MTFRILPMELARGEVSMREFIKKSVSRWLQSKHSQKLISIVLEHMTEARQKLRSSDSPFRGLARENIDKAEDLYQEALYNLKDGATDRCLEHCKKGMSYLRVAMMHLAVQKDTSPEPSFDESSAEYSIVLLVQAISRFKMGVEYTNLDVGKDVRAELVETVGQFSECLALLEREADEAARRVALSGVIRLYFLSKETGEKLESYTMKRQDIEKGSSGSSISRVLDLADDIVEVSARFNDSSPEAKPRVENYLGAARRTFGFCIQALADGDGNIVELARAGAMEVRMARDLIETSFGQLEPSKPTEDSELVEKIASFRRRVLSVQRVLRSNDPDSPKVVRRLQQVNVYYAKAARRLKSGELYDAERFARSAHLDVDYARQLFTGGVANYSQII